MTRNTPIYEIIKAYCVKSPRYAPSPTKVISGARIKTPHERHPTPNRPKNIPEKLANAVLFESNVLCLRAKITKSMILNAVRIDKLTIKNCSPKVMSQNEVKTYSVKMSHFRTNDSPGILNEFFRISYTGTIRKRIKITKDDSAKIIIFQGRLIILINVVIIVLL